MLGTSLGTASAGTGSRLMTKKDSYQYVPLIDGLTSLLSCEEIFSEVSVIYLYYMNAIRLIYRIMQIIRGEKLSWLHCLVEIREKTFAVVSFMQYLLTSLIKLSLKKFSTVNNLHYTVHLKY